MNQKEINTLQKVQLIIMDDIHRVCKNNNLKYYMIGGTMLGAIRHGGFIPWDMDIDIAMPRDDYEKFVSVYSKQLDKHFSCHNYKTDKNFHIPHAIVVLNNSTVEYAIDRLNPQINRIGIYVDVLPLDLCPDEINLRKKQECKINRIKKIIYYKNGLVYSKDNFISKAAKRMLRIILFLLPMKIVQDRLNYVMMKYNSKGGGDICSMVSHYGYNKLSMPKQIFGDPVEVPFAGRYYYAPHDYIEYLKRIFNDYMALPSEEVRQKQMDGLVSASWPDDIL